MRTRWTGCRRWRAARVPVRFRFATTVINRGGRVRVVQPRGMRAFAHRQAATRLSLVLLGYPSARALPRDPDTARSSRAPDMTEAR